MKRHTRAEVLRQGASVEWVKAYEAEAQRDALREALEDITQAAQQEGLQFSGWQQEVDRAVAALKATEER